MSMIKVTSIREVGDNNILKMAIKNNANLQRDDVLRRLVENDTSYVITIEMINQYELLSMLHVFGSDLKITGTNDIGMPDDKTFEMMFPGKLVLKEDDKGDGETAAMLAKYVTELCVSTVKQLKVDNDIVPEYICDMMVPMLCRTYNIEVPMAFPDFIYGIGDKYDSIFNQNYPETINSLDIDSTILRDITTRLPNVITPVIYDDKCIKLLDAIYYSKARYKIKGIENTGSIGITKITASKAGFDDISVNLFNSTKDDIKNTIQAIQSIHEPTIATDFVIKLPIAEMIDLLVSNNIRDIQYKMPSSITTIVDTGILPNYLNPNESDELSGEYKTRITELNEKITTSIGMLLQIPDSEPVSIMSIMPSIVPMNAVITYKKGNNYSGGKIVSEMFDMMDKMSDI